MLVMTRNCWKHSIGLVMMSGLLVVTSGSISMLKSIPIFSNILFHCCQPLHH